MKLLFLFILMFAPLACFAKTTTSSTQEQHQASLIHADELKSWLDQKKPLCVLDARSQPYFDGRLLPNAKWLSCETGESDITSLNIPKDVDVVVYCANVHCPASRILSEKLLSMGYTHVYEYPEGIDDWSNRGYPIN